VKRLRNQSGLRKTSGPARSLPDEATLLRERNLVKLEPRSADRSARLMEISDKLKAVRARSPWRDAA
jgi:hypothetical protein